MQHTQYARYFQSIFPGTSLLPDSTSPFFQILYVSQDQRQTMTIFYTVPKNVSFAELPRAMKKCPLQVEKQFLHFLYNRIIMVWWFHSDGQQNTTTALSLKGKGGEESLMGKKKTSEVEVRII